MTIKRRTVLKILGKEIQTEKTLKPGYMESINFDVSSGYDVPRKWSGLGYILQVLDDNSLRIVREVESWNKRELPTPRVYKAEEINQIQGHMIDMNDKDIS